MGEILNAYLESEQVKKKRQQIQRRLIFSKPVLGISLETITSKDTVKRTDAQTDRSLVLSDMTQIKEFESERLEEAGYYRISDINNRDMRLINREVDLPWNALKELKDLADKNDDTIPFSINEDVLQTIDRDSAVRRIVNCDAWASMFMYQYAMIRWCEKKSEEFLLNEEKKSKKLLIDEMIDGTYRPDNYVRQISEFVNASESYVKDVISGRVEYGLSDAEREHIIKRDNNMCQGCESEEDLEVHHIIPVNQGGDKSDKNLCTLCFDCHFNVAHENSTAEVSYNTREEFWEKLDDMDKNQND